MRPFNLRRQYKIRELDPTHVEKLITIKGIVIRCSDVIPELKEGYFRCYRCSNPVTVMVDGGKILEPDYCENCKSKSIFILMHNQSMYSDK